MKTSLDWRSTGEDHSWELSLTAVWLSTDNTGCPLYSCTVREEAPIPKYVLRRIFLHAPMTLTPALATFSCMQCLVLCSSSFLPCFCFTCFLKQPTFCSSCHAFQTSWHPTDGMQSSCPRLPFQHHPCESGLLSLHQPRGWSYPPRTEDVPTPSFFFSLPQPSYNPHLLCCFLHFPNQAPLDNSSFLSFTSYFPCKINLFSSSLLLLSSATSSLSPSSSSTFSSLSSFSLSH